MKLTLVDVARLWRFLREAGPNAGLWVEGVQHIAGGAKGDSWCMEMVWVVVCMFTQGNPPFSRLQVVQSFREFGKSKGWQVESPQPGDLVVSIDPSTDHGHHIGIVTLVSPLTAFAGNTSADGSSSNGDRAAEHKINPLNKEFFRLPIPAFLELA